MAVFRSCATVLVALLALLVTKVHAQTVAASNDTSDIPSYDSSPRFWVNGTHFTNFRIVPLGWYASISQQYFRSFDLDGRLLHVDTDNANVYIPEAISYLSCDVEDYPGVLTANDVLRIVTQQGNAIILYSTRANHCQASNLRAFTTANSTFTTPTFSTLDPILAASVLNQVQNSSSGMPGSVTPDASSYLQDNTNSSSTYTGSSSRMGPTTAVAMIILYAITGIITALFLVIIVTGAIRAHRHPERYGPRNVAGRPRRTRAKGIARAMLDTIPIVKFGDKEETPKKEVDDVEMAPSASIIPKNKSLATANPAEVDLDERGTGNTDAAAAPTQTTPNPDGTDEAGQLGCSICTEDFTMGEEVRVLPCNHKFHPDCVDPWLLNVSGTCPLCRIDLRPKEEQIQGLADGEQVADDDRSNSNAARRGSVLDSMIAPPLGYQYFARHNRDQNRRASTMSPSGRRDTLAFASLRSVASGSREDRIAALRRFRQQRRSRAEQNDSTSTSPEQEAERRGLSARLREGFRIRTRRQGEEADEAHAAAVSSVSMHAARL